VNWWSAYAAFAFAAISSRVSPAIAQFVSARYCGSTLRTAGGLRHPAPRPCQFQNSGSSKPAVQDRPTRQTQPLVPLTATT
jgi:hypothetical protein